MFLRLAPVGVAGVLLAAPSFGAADPVELAFAAAREYTAFVESRIETPFIEDEPGSFFGAGFLVDRERRWVLTNAHVAGRSPAHITVAFEGSGKRGAKPVHVDSTFDLAVLEVENGPALPATEARLDCGAVPRVGAPVGAFGHPNGFRFTGTRGIVAGVSTQLGAELLQIDAAVDHGNSGGPLIDLATGRVVGVNAFLYRGDGEATMGLAIEAPQACRLLAVLRRGGDPSPPELGLLFYRVDGNTSLTVAHASGAAAAAGVERGDRIVGVDGAALPRPSESALLEALRGRTGSTVLRIETADGERVDRTLALLPARSILGRRGVLLGGALIAPTNHRDTGLLDGAPTLMVHSIAAGSAAESAGLERFDHVLTVGGRAVSGLDDVVDRLRAEGDDAVNLDILRFAQDDDRFSSFVRVALPVAGAEWIAFGRPSEPVLQQVAARDAGRYAGQ